MQKYNKGILLLYDYQILFSNAATILENIEAFEKHSEFPVWKYNTQLGFPKGLEKLEFDVIVLHYSLFGLGYEYALQKEFLEYIQRSSALKIAFFQDDYRYCQKRFQFINQYKIHTVYTPLQSENIPKVYGTYTNAPYIFNYLCGYVSEDIIDKTKNHVKDYDMRTIDVSYRARELPYYLGTGGQEKHLIGFKFINDVFQNNIKLNLDIKVNFDDRIYGEDWYRFLGNSKAILGVESGGSIVDLHDEAVNKCEQYLKENPNASFEEVFKSVLYKYDNNIQYRVSSPRIFEGAALKCLMILYKGNYSGLVKPDIHYIPLEKDHSNFNEVISKLKDVTFCKKLIDNAYNDLILSGNYHYKKFIQDFDSHLKTNGIQISPTYNRKGTDIWFKKNIKKRFLMKYMVLMSKKYLKILFPKKSLLGTFLRKVAKIVKSD
ncbi:MAG: hypothetical protein EAZ55_07145 [Cytophagales bacterium]|nr:MAG: hypothetical protein EAZ55_07145 [Cytophagales bacterium]